MGRNPRVTIPHGAPKACRLCGNVYPNTAEYFQRAGDTRYPDLLRTECKACRRVQEHEARARRDAHKPKRQAAGSVYRNYRAQSELPEFRKIQPARALGSLSPFQRQRILRKALLIIWRCLLQWDYEQRAIERLAERRKQDVA